jgi:hypothetical protein
MTLTSKQQKALAKMPAGKRAEASRAFAQQNQTGKQSPAKKKAAPKRQPGPRPRGGGGEVFHPSHPGLIPSLVSEGNAFPISGVVRNTSTTSTSAKRIIIGTNTGRAGTVWVEVLAQASPATAVYTIPTLSAADTAGGPTSGRAMKFSLALVNVTSALKRSGRVFTLNANQRFSLPATPSSMNQLQWNDFASSVESHPHTVARSAHDFVHPQSMVAHPVDQSTYVDYGEWHGTYTFDEFMSHISIWPGHTPEDRPMSTIVMVIEPVSDENTYQITGGASFYTRWPLNTVMGQSMKNVPHAPASYVNKIRDHAESTSSMLRSVGEVVAAGTSAAAGAVAGVRALGTAARALPALEAGMAYAPLALMA